MNFALWSIWHILYIISPFLIFAGIYFLTRNSSAKTKDVLGYILGGISIFILLIRNVDIFIRNGWDLEVVPLQVCHIGSLVSGLALIFKKKWLILTSFCFHLIPALLAMVFADALVNYNTLWKIRPQTYIWGHIFIIVCALYGVFIHKPKLAKKDLYSSLIFVGCMAVMAIVCNSLFREALGWEPNYFYLFNYNGTPLKFLYNAFPSSVYGWFEINWFYVLVLLSVFIGVFVGLYFAAKYLIGKLSAKENGQKEL